MKIAYFMDTYLPQVTGISYALQKTIEQLISKGHEVYLISPSPKSNSGGKKFPAPSFSLPFRDQRIGFALPSSIGDMDIVHVHQPYTIGLSGLYKAFKEDTPLVYTFHTDHSSIINENTSLDFVGGAISYIFEKWERLFLRRSEKIISPTEIVRDIYLGDFEDKVEVVPNPIDTDLFVPSPSANTDEFSKIEGKVIGYAGRIAREKSLETLIKLAEYFEGNIFIVGNGEAEEYYRSLAREHSNIEFRDFIPRESLPRFYTSMDFFINPSISETQGMSVLEANSCGTPAIGARKMAHKEVIREGYNGLLFDPRDEQDLYDKLQEAYKTRRDLSKNSKRISSEYSPEKLTKEIIEVYKGLYE